MFRPARKSRRRVFLRLLLLAATTGLSAARLSAQEKTPIFRVLDLARQSFRKEKPDALVLIDYPGFHWWLARCARQ